MSGVERARDHHLAWFQLRWRNGRARCQEVPLCDTHSWSASARETHSQLCLHSVSSISTIHYGKKLGDGQEQRDPLPALGTRSWVPWRACAVTSSPPATR